MIETIPRKSYRLAVVPDFAESEIREPGSVESSPAHVQLYLRRLTKSEATAVPGTDDAIGPFFSPDGQWIGFFAAGQIKKVPVGGGPPVVICNVSWEITTDGGTAPVWAPKGQELFYLQGDSIMSVPFETTPTFTPENPGI